MRLRLAAGGPTCRSARLCFKSQNEVIWPGILINAHWALELDSLLRPNTGGKGMLDLGHFSHQVGGFD